MKRLVMAAAILAASVSAQAGCRMQANDSLEFKGDKQAHLVWSAIPGAAVAIGNEWLDLGMSKTTQFGVAMIPGTLREIATGCGRDTRGGFSWQDSVYNAIGVGLGMAAGNGVNIILKRNGIELRMELQ